MKAKARAHLRKEKAVRTFSGIAFAITNILSRITGWLLVLSLPISVLIVLVFRSMDGIELKNMPDWFTSFTQYAWPSFVLDVRARPALVVEDVFLVIVPWVIVFAVLHHIFHKAAMNSGAAHALSAADLEWDMNRPEMIDTKETMKKFRKNKQFSKGVKYQKAHDNGAIEDNNERS